jgi:6-phosphofructokinase 1
MDNNLPFKRLGVMTSGGDAPGMNTAVRAVVRAGLQFGFEVFGIERGFAGLLNGAFRQLNSHDAGNIMQRGGTVLGTARSEFFKTEQGRDQAMAQLHQAGIEGLIIIGGNGSLTGGLELQKMGLPVVGVPASIDNDLYGTSMAVGVDTCLNTIVDAIDKIKDTASSHQRAFVVEVMGRHSGYLALMSAMASGAEVAVIPEVEISLPEMAAKMKAAFDRGKSHFIALVAEGAPFKSQQIYEYLCEVGHFETRLTILGHLQRGGSPSAYDRILATHLGNEAVECLLEGVSGVMIGEKGGTFVRTPLELVVKRTSAVNKKVYELIQRLS